MTLAQTAKDFGVHGMTLPAWRRTSGKSTDLSRQTREELRTVAAKTSTTTG